MMTDKVGIVTDKAEEKTAKVGIYIHVPFCRSKCYYCDFCSKSGSNEAMIEAYADKDAWNRMSLLNSAAAGKFAADRYIEEYADRIWNLRKVK